MRAFILSMPDSRARRLSGLSKIQGTGLPFEIVDGVEARKMLPDALHIGDQPWPNLRPGEIGCYMGHLRILQRIVDYGLPWAYVLEDDFCFEADPDYGLVEIGEVLPADFDYVHLQRDVGINAAYRVIERCGPFLRVWETPLCSIGYIISRQLAQMILEQHAACCMPIDHLYARLSHNGRFYHVAKPLVGIQVGLDSDILTSNGQ